jgi:hypothetical protein
MLMPTSTEELLLVEDWDEATLSPAGWTTTEDNPGASGKEGWQNPCGPVGTAQGGRPSNVARQADCVTHGLKPIHDPMESRRVLGCCRWPQSGAFGRLRPPPKR